MSPANAILPPQAASSAAIYIRVSTEEQADQGYSLPTQRTACQTYAQQYGFTVAPAHVFLDDVSATTLYRPALTDLRALVQSRVIQAVIVFKLDRFARDLGGQILVVKEFAAAGVQVYDTMSPPTKPSPERTLFMHVQGAIAEYEHAQILERTERGRRGKAQAGIPRRSSVILGYRYAGEGKTGQYEIEPEEAALVQQIFRWYVEDGVTLLQIAARLNRQHVPTPQQRRAVQRNGTYPPPLWRISTLQYILTNDAYCSGTMYYGKTTNVVCATQPHKHTRHQKTDPATWIPITIPAIIPRSLLDAAADTLRRNAARSPRQRKRDYLLIGGRLRCEVCGHNMIGTMMREHRSYRCFRQYNGERRPACRQVRAADAEAKVWDAVCHLVRNPALLEPLLAEYHHTTQPAQLAQERATLDLDLHKVQRALERLLDLYLDATDSDAESRERYHAREKALKQDMTLLRTKLTALDAQEQAYEDAVEQRAHLTQMLQAVSTILDEATTIPAQQRILDMLGFTAFYTPDKQYRLQIVLLKRSQPSGSAVVPDSNTASHIGHWHTTEAITLSWVVAA